MLQSVRPAWLSAEDTHRAVSEDANARCGHVSEVVCLRAPLHAIPRWAHDSTLVATHRRAPPGSTPSNSAHRSTSIGPLGRPAECGPWRANNRGGLPRRHALESGSGNQRLPPPCRDDAHAVVTGDADAGSDSRATRLCRHDDVVRGPRRQG
jgi:hypothetical protein